MFSLASQWRMDEAFALLERLRPFHQDTAGFHNMDAFLLRETGQLAASNSAAKRSYELDPDTPSIGLGVALSYLLLQDTETAMEFVPPMMGVMRTYVMGTWEEAVPELQAALGDRPLDGSPMLISAYVDGSLYLQDYERVTALYDDGYDDIVAALMDDSFVDSAPDYVVALRNVGRAQEANELLLGWRAALERRSASGVNDNDHVVDWATYHALAGDHDKALAMLEKAAARGWRVPFWQYAVAFRQYFGDPRFEAIRARNLAAINAERAKLGWEPIERVGNFLTSNQET
jgi:tetratricopeptide (TPR) repeat protein